MCKPVDTSQLFSRKLQLREIVDTTVEHLRNDSRTVEVAIEMAAEQLEMRNNRRKAILYNKTFTVGIAEYRRVCLLFEVHLEAESIRISRRAEKIVARRNALGVEKLSWCGIFLALFCRAVGA